MEPQAAPESEKEEKFRSNFSLRKILIPVLIGLFAAAWLLYNDLSKPRFEEATNGRGNYVWVDANADGIPNLSDPAEFSPVALGAGNYEQVTARDVLRSIDWTWNTTFWMFLALIATACRELGYIYRIRILTDKFLTWRSGFNVVMLWEFASSLTPSVVGGSGFAMFIIDREGIPLGRSTAVVLVTALMDELFYVLMVPLVFIAVGVDDLFPPALDIAFWGLPIMTIFWIGYAAILVMVFTVFYAIFFRPRAFKYILLSIFKLKFLRRWRPQVIKVGDDIVLASAEFRGKPWVFWGKAFGATVLSWASRFLVINFIAAAFFTVGDHLLLYARQLVMWVILLISPTPGSSGVAEVAFSGFFKDLLPAAGLVAVLAIIWRTLSYYLYLFVGVIVLPRWLRNTRPGARS